MTDRERAEYLRLLARMSTTGLVQPLTVDEREWLAAFDRERAARRTMTASGEICC